ncbi:MAG TPA: TonB-dependent receptor [Vicinamibacterales bacterium]
MTQNVFRVTAFLVALLLSTSLAFAQSPTSSLSGVVTDTSGASIPGATVVVKSNATGVSYEAVTAGNGTFSVPALDAGKYSVTITLQGFKTVVLTDVEVNAGVPASVRAELEIGGLTETITVQGGTEIIQTQSATVSTTLSTNQIINLPLTSRNVVDFITFLPGVQTPGGNRDSIVNGLPQSTINMTVDGLNIQDNHLKTGDGFFARMSPRLDSVEQVTVTTAANGADSTGQGAVQVRFVTRSGSNQYTGSAYHFFRHDSLNATNWFANRDNLGKPELLQNQPGARLGGPVIIPGLFNGRDKAFFFVNYEELRQPQDVLRNRTVLSPAAQAGLFRYIASGQTREVDLLALAASRGHVADMDPTVAKLLADIRGTLSGGTVTDLTDPNLQRFSYLVPQRSHNIYPTTRIDWNLTDAHRLTGTFNYNHILSDPDTLNGRDPQFPGFPVGGVQDSDRYTVGASMRSTFGSNLVNEFRAGGTGGATLFSNDINAAMWSNSGLADEAGFKLGISAAGITNPSSGSAISAREASTKMIENTLNWLKGSHSFSFGANFTRVDVWLMNHQLVPNVNFGIVSGDPADSMFSTATFPGASSTQLNAARAIYSTLTGRISSITGAARLNESTDQYEYLGRGMQRGRMHDLGFFASDSWRMTPNFTVNLGLRYELQLPFYPLNNTYLTATVADVCGVSGVSNPDNGAHACNLFQPGNLAGQKPTFKDFPKGEYAYGVDRNNWAPSVGFAWVLGERGGLLGRVLGDQAVLRGGYALAYNRHGMSDFTGVFGANPGVTVTADRSQTLGNLGTLPLLFRDRSRLGPGDFPLTLTTPFTDAITQDVNIFDPNLQVPYADSWQFGLQRAISRNMVVEARYVGTRSRDGWTAYNYNELNIIENGFLEEFKLAQANLQANIAAGRGSHFRYAGPGTGTSPLPIFLAYFRGVGNPNDPSHYSSSLFANSTFVNPLAVFNPQPFTAANALDADATRRNNALAAGLPANFLVANPDLLGGANITGNGGKSRYDSLQMELRRRLANGLQFDSSYVYGYATSSSRYSFRRPRLMTENTGAEGNIYHALKATAVWDLPFGRGRRFGSDVGAVMDRVIGGWQLAGTARVQSGRLVDLGNVRLVGMTEKDVQDLFKLRIDNDGKVWMWPQAIIDETVKAFSTSATSPTGYGSLGAPSGRYFAPANGPDCIEIAGAFGDCGVRTLVVQGPTFHNYDLSIVKRIPIVGRLVGEFRVEALNVFNNVNFAPVAGISNDADDYEVTGLTGTNVARVVQLVSRITW